MGPSMGSPSPGLWAAVKIRPPLKSSPKMCCERAGTVWRKGRGTQAGRSPQYKGTDTPCRWRSHHVGRLRSRLLQKFLPIINDLAMKGRILSGQRLTALFLCYAPDWGVRCWHTTSFLSESHQAKRLLRDVPRGRHTSEEMAWGWEILPCSLQGAEPSSSCPHQGCQATSVAWTRPSCPSIHQPVQNAASKLRSLVWVPNTSPEKAFSRPA